MATINGGRNGYGSPFLRIVEKTMSQDINNNRSQLRVQLYFVVDQGTIGYTMNKPGRLTVSPGGSTTFNAPNRYVGGTGQYLLKEYWVWVPHNADGSARVNLSANYNAGITWNGQYISNMTVSGAVNLTNIPRGSVPTSASLSYHLNPDTANYLNIKLDVKLSGVTHDITIYDRNGNQFIGQWMGQTNPTRLTLNTTHVERMLNRMGNQITKNDFYVQVVTKRNGQTIQATTRNFSATVDDSTTRPIIEDYTVWLQGSGYDKTLNEYIQNVSKVHTKFKSRAQAGASIASRKITIRNGDEVYSGGWAEGDYFYHNSGILTKSGTYTITYEATDTRGLTTTQTRTFTVTAYSPPKIESFWAYRNEGRLLVNFRRIYSPLNGRNELSVSVSAKPRNGYSSNIHSSTSTTGSYTQVVQHYGASDAQAYDYTLTVSDQFGNKAEAVANIGTANVLMSYWEDKATGFGMFPSKRGVSSKYGFYATDKEYPVPYFAEIENW